jgi:competence protein ComEC
VARPDAVALAACGALALARVPVAAVVAGVLLVAGASAGNARIRAIDAPGRHLHPGDAVDGRGFLLEPPRPGRFGSSAPVAMTTGRARGARLLVRLPREAELPRRMRVGDEIALAGPFRLPRRRPGFDQLAYERRRGLAGELAAGSARPTGRHRGGVTGALDAVRARSEDAIAHGLPPPAADLALGMVLGEDQRISPSVRDDFQASGLAHVLAVSGQNVMLLVALVMPLLAAAGLRPAVRMAATVALIGVYVELAGAGPSLQRAGVMGAASLVALAAARPASRWYALLLAACVTLAVNPRSCADPGWQLSFAAVAGILLLAPLLRAPLSGLPGPLAEGIAITVAATVSTAPLMGHHFGAVSVAGLPANVAALALVAPIMWLGMVRAVLGQLGPAAEPLIEITGLALGPALRALGSIAYSFAGMRGGRLALPLGSRAELGLAYAALGAVACAARAAAARVDLAPARGRWRRAPRRARAAAVAGAGAALALAVLVLTGPGAAPSRFTVSYLDVGQGDSTLIQAPGGTTLLFDGGPPEGHVTRLLRRAGVRRIDLLVLTHQSRDHHAGLQDVVEHYPVRTLLDGGDGTRDPTFLAVVAAARARRARVVAPRPGQVLEAGPVRVRIYGPPPRPPGPPPDDPNPRAIAAVVSYGAFDLFLSGDAESDGLAGYRLPPVDAMKVSHHGSSDPGLPALLERLRPRVAGIEVGEGNSYGHPAPGTLRALAARVPRVYRTDRDGTVRLTLRGGRMDVETER